MSANHSFAILERPYHNSHREVFPNAANRRVVTPERVWGTQPIVSVGTAGMSQEVSKIEEWTDWTCGGSQIG